VDARDWRCAVDGKARRPAGVLKSSLISDPRAS
jgi:hypothetical protein